MIRFDSHSQINFNRVSIKVKRQKLNLCSNLNKSFCCVVFCILFKSDIQAGQNIYSHACDLTTSLNLHFTIFRLYDVMLWSNVYFFKSFNKLSINNPKTLTFVQSPQQIK